MILRYERLLQTSVRIFIRLIEKTATLIVDRILIANQIIVKQRVICDRLILNAIVVRVVLKTSVDCIPCSLIIDGFFLSFKGIHI